MSKQKEYIPHSFAHVIPRRTPLYFLYWTISIIFVIVLAPIRIICMLTLIYLQKITIQLLTRNLDVTKPMHHIRSYMIWFFTKIYGRLFLFLQGCVRIKEVNKHLKFSPETSYVVISNHVSSLDPLVHICLGCRSFVAKDDLKKMPGFGISSWAMQSIFVERNTKNTQEKVLNALRERIGGDIHDKGLPRKFPLLCVYPEGTTTNQLTLLPFKKGAFLAGKPVNLMVTEYDNRFIDHSDAGQSMVKCALMSVMGLFYTVKVTYLGEYVPTAGEIADPLLYAENVREVYFKKLAWDKVEYTYKDKSWFMRKKNAKYEDCSKIYKENFEEKVGNKNFFIHRHDALKHIEENQKALKQKID